MAKVNDKTPPSLPVRIIAASFVGGLEGIVLAPLDAAKQFQMHHKGKTNVGVFQAAVGTDYASLSRSQRFSRAWGSALPYCITKIVARGGKLSVVPYLRDQMKLSTTFTSLSNGIGTYNAGLVCSTIAGMSGGVFEALTTQPFDRWKVETQITKQPAMSVASKLIAQPLPRHYTALKETLYRNAWGSGVLFFSKDAAAQALGAKDLNNTTPGQKIGSGLIASWLAIIASHPQDMAKVRKQMNPTSTLSMLDCMRDVVSNEGLLGLTKGLPVKLANTGVKLGLVLAGVDQMTEWLQENIASNTPVI
jgi:hypothetical protein